jgi:hypothetical protein
LTFHRNGFQGAVAIDSQKWRDGRWVLVAACGGCGALYRLEQLADARPYIDSVIKLAEHLEHQERIRPPGLHGHTPTPETIAHAGHWHREVAARIVRGYEGQL